MGGTEVQTRVAPLANGNFGGSGLQPRVAVLPAPSATDPVASAWLPVPTAVLLFAAALAVAPPTIGSTSSPALPPIMDKFRLHFARLFRIIT